MAGDGVGMGLEVRAKSIVPEGRRDGDGPEDAQRSGDGFVDETPNAAREFRQFSCYSASTYIPHTHDLVFAACSDGVF